MHFVYLLKSEKDKKFYIGCTDNLKRRFSEHNNGLVKSTKHRRPLQLVYYEAYNNKQSATGRESCLKGFGSAYYALLKRIGLQNCGCS